MLALRGLFLALLASDKRPYLIALDTLTGQLDHDAEEYEAGLDQVGM